MASLQLLRFCCPVGSPAAELVRHFHPQLWHGLCLGSAGLGLAGLLLQALPGCCRGHGRRAGRGSQGKLCAARGIGAALAASCWLGTAGILGRSVLWLTASPDSVGQPPVNGTAALAGPLCIVAVMWGQYFYTAHFWALFCYALEAVQLLRRPAGCRPLAPYCLLCWGASSTQCLWGVQQLLSPAHASCDAWHPLAAWHYVAAYVPLVLVLLVNPLLLSRALSAAAALLRRQTGMYTARERLQEWQLRRRFTSITVTFTACWLANVVNDGLLFLVELQPAWHMETPRLVHVAILTSWIIVAILNPVSGFLLSLAFLGWQSAWQPAGRALCGGRQSSSKDSDERTSPAPVVGLVAPNPHSTLDSRAPLELIYLLAETGALHPAKAELRAPAPREGSPDGGCSIITAGCAPAPLATELLPGTGQAGVTHFPRLAGGTERAVGRSSQARPHSWALLTAGQGAGGSSSLRAGSPACPTGPALAQTGCREGLCQGEERACIAT